MPSNRSVHGRGRHGTLTQPSVTLDQFNSAAPQWHELQVKSPQETCKEIETRCTQSQLPLHRRRAIAIFSDSSTGISVTTVQVSLICPISNSRAIIPARGPHCEHLNCFDLQSWALLASHNRSLRDPTTKCPICNKKVSASTIIIDDWVKSILAATSPETRAITLYPDGNFIDATHEKNAKRDNVAIDLCTQQAFSQGASPEVHIKMEPNFSTTTDHQSSKLFGATEEDEEMSAARLNTTSSMTMQYTVESTNTHHYDQIGNRPEWIPFCSICNSTQNCQVGAHSVEEDCVMVTCCHQRRPKSQFSHIKFLPGGNSLELSVDGTWIVRCATPHRIATPLTKAGFFLSDCGKIFFRNDALQRIELDYVEALVNHCVSTPVSNVENPLTSYRGIKPIPDMFLTWQKSSSSKDFVKKE